MSPKFVSGSPAANGGLFAPYNLNGVLTQRHFDIALFAFTEPPDPQVSEGQFLPTFIPTATVHSAEQQNYTGITDQDEATLLIKARPALDTAQRHALFNQWQALINNRVYWIMIMNATRPISQPHPPNLSSGGSVAGH